MNRVLNLVAFNIRVLLGDPTWFILSWALFALQLAIYGSLISRRVGSNLPNYFFVYIIGLMIIVVFESAEDVGRHFVEHAHEGELPCFLSLSVSRSGFVFFSSRSRHTTSTRDWSSDVCSSDLLGSAAVEGRRATCARPPARRARRHRARPRDGFQAARPRGAGGRPATRGSSLPAPRGGRGSRSFAAAVGLGAGGTPGRGFRPDGTAQPRGLRAPPLRGRRRALAAIPHPRRDLRRPRARAGGGAAGRGHGRHARGRGVSRGDRGPDRPRPARGGGARGRARPAPRRRRPAGGHGTARAPARPRPSRPRPDGGPAGGVPGGGGGAQGTPARRHPRRPGRRGRVAGLPHGGGALGGARPRPLAGAAGTGRAPRRARRHSLPRARMTEPALSVVVPALNEEDRLPRTLERIVSHLGRRREGYALVVGDDGSRERTAERAQAAGATVLRNEATRGKGYAVRRGMLAASGARRLMTDADLSTPIEELDRLCARMDEGRDR